MRACIITILTITALSLPTAVVFAQGAAPGAAQFQPITNIGALAPGGANTQQGFTTAEFIRILYALSISVAGLLAVVKIIYAGVQYMLSDVVTSKAQAKKDLWGAIFGFIIVLSAVFILQQINPRLTQFDLFSNAPATGPINGSGGGGTQSAVQRTNDYSPTGGGNPNQPANDETGTPGQQY